MKNIKRLKTLNKPCRYVYVGAERGEAPDGWDECLFGENLVFNASHLASFFHKQFDDLIFDAFILAAAVEYCDYIQKRHNDCWGRDFYLSVPVETPDHWNSREVYLPLISGLNKLTGDKWCIEFRKRTFAPEQPQQSELVMIKERQAVIAYSDGMDSLSVAGITSEQMGEKLVRVRLGKKSEKKKVPFIAVPYELSKKNRESSGRSRGFKFSILTGAAAYLSNASSVIIPESGQGSLGPAFVPLAHASIDYRNHPIFLSFMKRFLSALFGHKFEYQIPRLWNTKGETLSEYIKVTGDQTEWRKTISCWRNQRQTSVDGKKRQCGICAACLLRRMSVHAAYQEEDQNTYLWNNLNAEELEFGSAKQIELMNDFHAHKKYAVAGIAHLRDMANLLSNPLEKTSLEAHAHELSHSLNLDYQYVINKQNRLLEKHSDEWNSFLNSLSQDSFVRKIANGNSYNAA